MLVLLTIGMLSLAFNIQPAKSEWTGTVYIRADGSIDPPDAPITTYDNIIYTLIDNVTSSGDGIVVEKSNIIINGDGNTIQGSGSGYGFYLSDVSNVTIKNAKIQGFGRGVYIVYSDNNTISGNTIKDNCAGLTISDSRYNTVVNNIVGDNRRGVGDGMQIGGTEHTVSNNVVFNNTGCGISLHGSSMFVTKNNASNNENGIELYDCSSSMLVCNTAINNAHGFYLWQSNDNVLIGNILIENYWDGIQFSYSSREKLVGNTFVNNSIGLVFGESYYNIIYHNNFVNPWQIYKYASTGNVWDDGYPSGGNYWSDYTGVDADGDGIGDTPYVIDADNQDRYPLMHPWSPLPVHNINTGLGYKTIQEAIDAPETLDGHTIFVEAGTYYENVIVNKTVSLIGENKESTIIDGNGTGTVVYITADNVTVSGFTIQRCGIIWSKFIFPEYGIRLRGHNCNLTDNIIANNDGTGIFVEVSNDNIICGNIIVNNIGDIGDYRWGGPAYGIDLEGDNCIVSNNLIANNSGGIFLMGVNNLIEENVIINNTYEPTGLPPYNPPFRQLAFGINVARARNSIINSNVVNDNYFGIFLVLDHSYDIGNVLRNNSMNCNHFNFGIYELANFQQEIDTSNTVNGKTIYYWINQHNKQIPCDAGYVALINCTNILVKGLNLTNNFQGIFVYNTTSFTIERNMIANNCDSGVGLWESKNGRISNNIIANNNGTKYGFYGFGIRGYYSQRIYVINNTISNNEDGINELWRNWTISGNIIANNSRGIVDSFSETYSENIIFHNNFINNTQQVFSRTNASRWDNGFEGNFWSDYNGADTDQDGIGEAPYIIHKNVQDNYPLMGMFQSFNTSLGCSVDVISNSTVEDFRYFESNSSIIMHVSNMTANQTVGFCRLTIPHDVIHPPYTVKVNGTTIEYQTLYENHTEGISIIYFTYGHSKLEITVIPEYPSMTIMLLLSATLVTTALTKRKLQRRKCIKESQT